MCERGTIGFGFTSHDLVEKIGASFVNQSKNVVMQNESQRAITFDTQSKTMALYPGQNSSSSFQLLVLILSLLSEILR